MNRRASLSGTGSRTASYLYGVMLYESDVIDALPKRGIANREVRVVPHEDIAAVISPVESAAMSGTRTAGLMRNLRAHTAVLTGIAEKHTILPAGFGIEMGSTKLQLWLNSCYDALRAQLEGVEGQVELKVQVTYTLDGGVRELLKNRPRLISCPNFSRGLEDRIAIGKTLFTALQEKAGQEGRNVLNRLSQVAEQVLERQPGERGVVSLSLLVRRDRISEVDQILREIDSERGDVLEISCVGPLPPFSFVTPLLERRKGYRGII